MENEYTDYLQRYLVNLFASCFSTFIFIVLLSLDLSKAFKRRAHWIPAEALVLSALIIQLLTFIDNWNLNVNSDDKDLKDVQLDLLIEYSVIHDVRRVMICLLIGYLLPGMVRSGLRAVWSNTGALALSVIWHMSNEIYFLVNVKKEEMESPAPSSPAPSSPGESIQIWLEDKCQRIWFIVSYITFFTALLLLVVLLTSAVIAGKSICKIFSQKVRSALSCCSNCPEKQECEDIKNHILKCWIVSRASQPDYIMARSVLTSFAGLVNTVCFVLLVVKTIWYWESFNGFTWEDILIYFIEFAFVFILWIVVLLRWFTAVMYFPRDAGCLFNFEDFWTRSLVDMKMNLDAHLGARLFSAERILMRILISTVFKLPSILLIKGLRLQRLMVLLSKACWGLSDLALSRIRHFVLSPKENAFLCGLNVSASETDQFDRYKEALEIIRMPGEIARSLWIANLSAFRKAEKNMSKGFECGKNNCAELINLMGHTSGMVDEEVNTLLEDRKHFKDLVKKSWKMRAISLIHIMIYFYDGTHLSVVKDVIQACSEAWCFMDMVDNLDSEVHLINLAAYGEFGTIKNICKNHLKTLKNSDELPEESIKLLEEKIKKPLRQRMEQFETEEKEGEKAPWAHDSKDWMAVAVNSSLYRTWKAMEHHSSSVNAIHDIRRSLANIFVHCIGKELDRALRENCLKWAENGNENEIFSATYIVGKAKGVREQMMEGKHAVCDQTKVGAGEVNNISGGVAVQVDGDGNGAGSGEVEAGHAINDGIESEMKDDVQGNVHPHASVDIEEMVRSEEGGGG